MQSGNAVHQRIIRGRGAPREASRKSGRVSRRSVCPVGAVSNTILEKCAYSGFLTNCTTLLMATASSTPGGSVSSTLRRRSFSWSPIAPRQFWKEHQIRTPTQEGQADCHHMQYARCDLQTASQQLVYVSAHSSSKWYHMRCKHTHCKIHARTRGTQSQS